MMTSRRGERARGDVTAPALYGLATLRALHNSTVYRRQPTMSQLVPAVLYPSLLDDMDTFYDPLFDFGLDPKAVSSFFEIIFVSVFLNKMYPVKNVGSLQQNPINMKSIILKSIVNTYFLLVSLKFSYVYKSYRFLHQQDSMYIVGPRMFFIHYVHK